MRFASDNLHLKSPFHNDLWDLNNDIVKHSKNLERNTPIYPNLQHL